MNHCIAFSLYMVVFCFVLVKTIVCSKEYIEIPWASLRTMLEPLFAKRSVINHKDYLTNDNLVRSSAINVTETEVFTADGQQIAYDFLVVATGHADPFPQTKSDRLNQYKEDNSE